MGGLSGIALLAMLASTPASSAQPHATLVHVDKSERRMFVYEGDKVIAAFVVGLGFNALGPKQRQGDGRTPEGRYLLDYKNERSGYYRSIHISYPNDADRAAARKLHVSPGGDIMVHGLPNDPHLAHSVRTYGARDWTNGCIALSDEDMKRLWDLVATPVPIEIVP